MNVLRPTGEIFVNGNALVVPCGMTIEELLVQMKWSRRGIAVEVNSQIVAYDQFGTLTLNPGDCLEVVVLAGGG